MAKKKVKKPEKKAKGFIWPVNSKRITQRLTGSHHGVDVGVPIGTRLVAPEGGTVTAAGTSSSGYGKYVQIKTSSGETVILGHLSQVQVKPGQKVQAGQQVGLSGNTGNSTGPHVHIEVRSGSGYLDPLELATGSYQVTKGATTTPATKSIKAEKAGTEPANGGTTLAGKAGEAIQTVFAGVSPDIQINWGNIAAGVIGVALITIGVAGLVMGETVKAALQPITEPIAQAVRGEG